MSGINNGGNLFNTNFGFDPFNPAASTQFAFRQDIQNTIDQLTKEKQKLQQENPNADPLSDAGIHEALIDSQINNLRTLGSQAPLEVAEIGKNIAATSNGLKALYPDQHDPARRALDAALAALQQNDPQEAKGQLQTLAKVIQHDSPALAAAFNSYANLLNNLPH